MAALLNGTTTGRIVIAQEDRFVLEADSGGHRLFILAHGTLLEPADLRRLERSGERVSVSFSESAHLVAAVAERITVADGSDERTSSAGPRRARSRSVCIRASSRRTISAPAFARTARSAARS
jgi:hypothetical protein